jgi:hypothetical protein
VSALWANNHASGMIVGARTQLRQLARHLLRVPVVPIYGWFTEGVSTAHVRAWAASARSRGPHSPDLSCRLQGAAYGDRDALLPGLARRRLLEAYHFLYFSRGFLRIFR